MMGLGKNTVLRFNVQRFRVVRFKSSEFKVQGSAQPPAKKRPV
jgi:hypothetical protein